MGLSCIVIDDELHAIGELSELIEDNLQLQLKGTFTSAADALQYLNDAGKIDIVFCDINMPRMNGLEAAKVLHPFCRFLVFVTAHREHALTAFEKNASGYLVKPLNDQHFTKLINSFLIKDKVFLSDQLIEKEGVIFVKGGGKNEMIKIDLDEIKYIKAYLNYSMIHLVSGNDIVTYILLGDFEKKLKGSKQFFRVNKSNIVAMRFFKKIIGNNLYLETGEPFAIGNKYKAALLSFVKKRSLNF